MGYEVAKVKDYPELEGMVFKMKRLHSEATKWHEENCRAMNEFMEKYKNDCSEVWEQIEDFIVEKKLVRDNYDKENDGLSFEEDHTILVCSTREDIQKSAIADLLLSQMPKELREHLMGKD